MTTREAIKEILEIKKKTRSKYSMRVLAQKSGISSGRLSEILSGRRQLTDHYFEKICLALQLTEDESAQLRKIRSLEIAKGPPKDSPQNTTYILSQDQISKLVSWKPYALMTLVQTEGYADFVKTKQEIKAHAVWAGQKLEISESEAFDLLKMLVSLGLINWKENRLEVVNSSTTTGYDIPTEALRKSLWMDLSLAQEKLESVPVLEREFTTMSLAMNPQDMVRAKKMIRHFVKDFTHKMEKSKKEVYQLSVQFFPLTRSGE